MVCVTATEVALTTGGSRSKVLKIMSRDGQDPMLSGPIAVDQPMASMCQRVTMYLGNQSVPGLSLGGGESWQPVPDSHHFTDVYRVGPEFYHLGLSFLLF